MADITARQVNPAGTRVYMATLSGGVDLHTALVDLAHSVNALTATFDLLGGLTAVDFTAYDFTTQTRLPAITFERALEIVSGHGTIAQLDGTPHIHTHLTVAFRDLSMPHGIAVVGGHAARALCYAVECTLTVYDGAPVQRGDHPATGLKLWDLPAL